jgi:hypothetical protein
MRLIFVFLLSIVTIENGFADQSVQSPSDLRTPLAESVAGCDSQEMEAELARFKRQPLQSVAISSGWMEDLGSGLLSGGFTEVSIGSGIPLGSFDNFIGVTPRFRIDWIQADPTIDIPEELYDFGVQFFYRRPINERASWLAIVSPSIRSDLTTSDHAFRVFALLLYNWEWIPETLTLSGGAVVLGRADIPVLPAVGLTWTPDRWSKLELRFPVSRFSYRIAKEGSRSEKWIYVNAGLGGNTWAVTRRSDSTDELSLQDLRLTAGIEKIVDGGGGWFAETGFAFARRIEYERTNEEQDLSDAWLVNAGWRY